MVQGGQVDHGEPQTWLASERAKRPGLEALLPPSAEEEELISTAFSALEDDPTGVIDYYGVKAALKGLGLRVSKNDLLQALEQCCPHTSEDSISRADFAAVAMRFLKRRGEGEQLQVDMEIFDVQGKGFVDAADVRRVTRRIHGSPLPDSEIAAMIRGFDKSGLGRLGPNEFAAATQA